MVVKKQEEKVEEFDFETFQIKTVEDIRTWNYHARKAHKEARKMDKHAQPPIPIKVPDETMYDKVRVKFQRFDQPSNILKAFLRNRDIAWKGQLKGGKTYDLCKPVVRFLNALSTPLFAEVKVEDGGETRTETRQVGEQARFSCQVLDWV